MQAMHDREVCRKLLREVWVVALHYLPGKVAYSRQELNAHISSSGFRVDAGGFSSGYPIITIA